MFILTLLKHFPRITTFVAMRSPACGRVRALRVRLLHQRRLLPEMHCNWLFRCRRWNRTTTFPRWLATLLRKGRSIFNNWFGQNDRLFKHSFFVWDDGFDGGGNSKLRKSHWTAWDHHGRAESGGDRGGGGRTRGELSTEIATHGIGFLRGSEFELKCIGLVQWPNCT